MRLSRDTKRWTKGLKCFFLVLSLFFACNSAKATESIATCLDYSPYVQGPDGQRIWSGGNVETLYYLLEGLNYQVDASIRAPFVRCMKLLEQGKIDIVSGLIYTKERAQRFLLVPYSTKERLAIFYLKTSKKSYAFDQFAPNALIGMHRAFALPDQIKTSPIYSQLVPIRSVGTGLDMVVKNRIDGVLATVATGLEILNEESDYGALFTFQPLPYFGEEYVYFGISKSSPLASKVSQINFELKRLANDPEKAHLQVIAPKDAQ